MMMAEEKNQIRDKFNMEIFIILPYKTDSLATWVVAFPKSIQTIEKWKYPGNDENISEKKNKWAEYCREFYPYSFERSKKY